MHFSFSRRNPLLLNGSVDVKGRNGSTNSNSGNAFIDCTLESLAAEDLKNEVRQIEIEIQVRVGFPSFTTVFCLCHFQVGILQSRLLELECSMREKDRQLAMKDSQERNLSSLAFLMFPNVSLMLISGLLFSMIINLPTIDHTSHLWAM